jgi:hypothetical protein
MLNVLRSMAKIFNTYLRKFEKYNGVALNFEGFVF